jgi:hypothetical protein
MRGSGFLRLYPFARIGCGVTYTGRREADNRCKAACLFRQNLNPNLCFITINSVRLEAQFRGDKSMLDHTDQQRKSTFVLPFATPAANRLKDFTKTMEMAAIVYLAESGRRKGESHILKKPDEKLVFIAEAGYPIWLVPHHTATLLFDGLGLACHTFSYSAVPDIDLFINDIQESQKTTETYIAALVRNADYFKSCTSSNEESIDGLITAPDLLEDFTAYFSQMMEPQTPGPASTFLTPTIGDREIRASIGQLFDLKKRADENIGQLDAAVKILNAATKVRVRALREEMRTLRELHDRQLAKIKLRVTREIAQIRNACNRELARTTRESKKKLQRLRKSRVQLQKTLRHLKAEAKRCESRIRSGRRCRKHQKDTRWTLTLKRVRKKLPTLEKELKETTKRIQKTDAAQSLAVAQQKAECDSRIDAVNKTLQDLQVSKTDDLAEKHQEIATIENTTSHITTQMLEMVLAKKTFREELDTIAVFGKRQASVLVHVPFYLIRYDAGDQRRYAIYAPSIVGDLGTVTRMKGALGVARMKALFRPRSRAVTTFLNQVVALLERNPMLEKEVTEAGIQRSILLTRQLRMDVRKGLQELETEEWISPDELQNVSELLYMYV